MSDKLALSDDDGCFACGKSNPIGLKLDFAMEGEEYVTYFVPEKAHQGWLGIAHGGIVSTVMDEVMARSLHVTGVKAVTGEMTVRFVHPAKVGARIRFAGQVDSENGRVIQCSARATDEDGNRIAEASAKMVKVTDYGK